MDKIHFINLTNGIQAIKEYNIKDPRFIRIQSTACEQKRWDFILLSISDEFLLSAALGKECIVYDYGANKEVPRAIWQGLEWIKFSLHKRWFGAEYQPTWKASSSKKYFEKEYSNLTRNTKARLDYFKTFLNGELNIHAITSPTTFDGNKEYYRGILL